MVDPMTMMALASVAQGVYGAVRGVKANQGLNELAGQPMDSYAKSAGDPLRENYRLSQMAYRQGMTPASLALAKNTFASSQASQLRNARELSGGQLSSSLGRMMSTNQGRFGLELAAQNEAIKRQGLAGMMQANLGLSGLMSQDVSQNLRYRMMQEQALGQAKQQAVGDIFGAATGYTKASLGQQNAAADRQMYRDLYGAGKTPSSLSMVNPSGTFAPLGPMTREQAMGVPAGTTSDAFSSYAPGYTPSAPAASPYGFAPTGSFPFSSAPAGTTIRNGAYFAPGYTPSAQSPYANMFALPAFNPYINYGKNMYGPDYISSKG